VIDLHQFENLIVTPTLNQIELASPAAVELLVGTAIQESRITFVKQLGDGPALGVFQMEPATHDDIWENYLLHRPELAALVARATRYPGIGMSHDMVGNLWYATAMARVHYRRVPEPLPEPGDLEGMANYWKDHYNTHQGAGTVEEYIEHWHEAYGTD